MSITLTGTVAGGLNSGSGSGTVTLSGGVPGPNLITATTATDLEGLLYGDGSLVEAIPLSTYSRSLLGLADAAAGRSALGLGSASLLDAANVAKLDAANVFTASQEVVAPLLAASLVSSSQDANSVSPTPRIRFRTYRGASAADAYFFRGKLHLPQIINQPSLLVGDSGGPESDGFLGDGIGSVVGNGGLALYSGHTPRLAVYYTTVGMPDTQIFGWYSNNVAELNTAFTRPAAGNVRLSRLGTNGESSILSFAGPSSLGTLRDVGVITSSYATATDASFQGQLSLGVRGIVGATDTLQTGLTVTARSGGLSKVVVSGDFDVLFPGEPAYFSLLSGGGYPSLGFKNSSGVSQVYAANYGSYLSLASSWRLAWSATASASEGAEDIAFSRNAAGVVEVNNGTAGQFRDLVARKVSAPSGFDTVNMGAHPISGAMGIWSNTYTPYFWGTLGYPGANIGWAVSLPDYDLSPSMGTMGLLWTETRLSRSGVGNARFSRLGTNGTAGVISLAGPSSTGAIHDVAVFTGGYETASEASFQGQLLIGVKGIVGSTETLQTGLTVTAQASGTPLVSTPNLTTSALVISLATAPLLTMKEGGASTTVLEYEGSFCYLGPQSNTNGAYLGFQPRTAGPGRMFANTAGFQLGQPSDMTAAPDTARLWVYGSLSLGQPSFNGGDLASSEFVVSATDIYDSPAIRGATLTVRAGGVATFNVPSNVPGSPLNLRGGRSSGTGIGGAVVIQSAPAGSSGNAINPYSTLAEFKGDGIGFFGATPVAKPTFAADATDLATALTLVNDLKARLVAYGLGA